MIGFESVTHAQEQAEQKDRSHTRCSRCSLISRRAARSKTSAAGGYRRGPPYNVYRRSVRLQPDRQAMNPLYRIARALLILALGFNAPQSYVRADGSATSRLDQCVDQQIFCANFRTSEARDAIVSSRAASEFSLKSVRRSSSWQAAVPVAVSSPSTSQDSNFWAGRGRVAPAPVARSATPVRAPPASA